MVSGVGSLSRDYDYSCRDEDGRTDGCRRVQTGSTKRDFAGAERTSAVVGTATVVESRWTRLQASGDGQAV